MPPTLRPTVLLLGVFLKETSSDIHQKICTKMSIIALFVRVTHLETLKSPSIGPTVEYHAAIKMNIVMSERSQIKKIIRTMCYIAPFT